MPVAPHDANAEADLISLLLTRPPIAERVFDLVTASDFYVPKHRRIVQAIEDVNASGRSTDTTTVAARLAELRVPISAADLRAIALAASPILDADEYAHVVVRRAACRRAIDLADRVQQAGWAADIDRVMTLLGEDIAPPVSLLDAGMKVGTLLDSVEPPYNWCVEGLLEYRDRVIFTGSEGGGKSTLLRQIGACAAAGEHPFWLSPVPKRRVVVIDLENTRQQCRREYRPLHERFAERDSWDDALFTLYCRPEGLDLSAPSGAGWLRAVIEHHRPELVCLGPLYKSFQGGPGRKKDSEETAQIVMHLIDRLRVAHGCAFVMEGHSPHGEHGDREGLRMRGSAAWLGWPEFMFGLHKQQTTNDDDRPWVRIKEPRAPRDRTRRWPKMLMEGRRGELPWVVAPNDHRAQRENTDAA